jgi:hypothetical protein
MNPMALVFIKSIPVKSGGKFTLEWHHDSRSTSGDIISSLGFLPARALFCHFAWLLMLGVGTIAHEGPINPAYIATAARNDAGNF